MLKYDKKSSILSKKIINIRKIPIQKVNVNPTPKNIS